uniref:Uncharacterized protein n=1 Tax=Rhizophora mucronata TaxID=61149 RepID=A0A2P2PQZ9_RHIMU
MLKKSRNKPLSSRVHGNLHLYLCLCRYEHVCR